MRRMKNEQVEISGPRKELEYRTFWSPLLPVEHSAFSGWFENLKTCVKNENEKFKNKVYCFEIETVYDLKSC